MILLFRFLRQPVIDVQANSIFDICQHFFVSVTLRVAALQRETLGEIAISIFFNNDWQIVACHNSLQFLSVDELLWLPSQPKLISCADQLY